VRIGVSVHHSVKSVSLESLLEAKLGALDRVRVREYVCVCECVCVFWCAGARGW
jgi:hypothetical protein